MHNFAYHRPPTLDELRPLLGTDTAVLAGGQSLLPLLKARGLRLAHVVDIKHVLPSDITIEGERLIIGAGATHAQIVINESMRTDVPILSDLADHVGDPSVRHRGTVGGSLAANHPAGDWPAAALALDAILHTSSRDVSFQDYVAGDVALSEEIILHITLRLPDNAAYVKLLHPAQRYAIVGAFVATTDDGLRVTITGLASTGTFRWHTAEELLTTDLSPAALEEVVPPTGALRNDSFATPRYRQHLARALTQRAVAQLTGAAPRQIAIVHGQAG